MSWHSCIAVLIGIALGAGGCRHAPVTDAGVLDAARRTFVRSDVPQVRAVMPFGDDRARLTLGSGLYLLPGVFATCHHVAPHDAKSLYVDGEAVRFIVLESGGDDKPGSDWTTVFLVDGDHARTLPYTVDPTFEPPIGSTVIAMGYPVVPTLAAGQGPESAQPSVLTVVAGEVIATPSDVDAGADHVCFLTVEGTLTGLSGGPVLAWDGTRWVAFAMLTATVREELRFPSVEIDRYHVSRRLTFFRR